MGIYAKNDIIGITIDFEKETLYHFQSISKYVSENKPKLFLKKSILKNN